MDVAWSPEDSSKESVSGSSRSLARRGLADDGKRFYVVDIASQVRRTICVCMFVHIKRKRERGTEPWGGRIAADRGLADDGKHL